MSKNMHENNIYGKLVLFLLLIALCAPSLYAAGFAAPDAVAITTKWSSGGQKNSSSNAQILRPGSQSAVAIVLHIKRGFHVNPNKAQIPDNVGFSPIPTKITLSQKGDSSPLIIGAPQFPKPTRRSVQYAKDPLPVYENKAVIYVPVIVKDNAKAGAINLQLSIQYQACNDKVCLRPRTVVKHLKIKISNAKKTALTAGSETGASGGKLFANFDTSVFAAMQAGKTAGASGAVSNSAAPNFSSTSIINDFFGLKFSLNSSSLLGLVLILLVALAAGFLLNFTPCVLPVVPLKIMSLQQQAHNDIGRIKNGAVFCFGIVATFAFLGALVGGLIVGLGQFQWGSIFSYAPVSIALGAIIILMALGMLGLFSMRLPKWIYAIKPSQDKASGNFLFGVLTAVLSTPCTGPLLGATIVWAVKQSAFLAIASFVVMGIGMALPYAVLTANPKWLDKLPRAGAGSLLLKQTLALLLLAVALFFLSPVIPGNMVWWLIAGFIFLAMVWLVYRTFDISAKLIPRLVVAIFAVALICGSASAAWMLTRPGPIKWQSYSQNSFAQAQQNGKTILVEFTADWCGNCKALELTVYRDSKLAALLRGSDYKAYQVDLTSSANKKGWSLQRKLAPGAGIPLAAVYKQGKQKPVAVFQGLFTANQLIEALK